MIKTVYMDFPVAAYQRLLSVAGYDETSGPYLSNDRMTRTEKKTSVDTGCFVPGVYRVNPYSVSRETYDIPDLTVVVDHSPDEYWTYVMTNTGKIGGRCISYAKAKFGSVDFGNLGARALQKAYAKIGQSSVGAGETLGELRETLQMLQHPIKGLRDFLWSTNHRNLGILNCLLHYRKSGRWLGKSGWLTGKDAAKEAAGAWLEFRYGFMPLIYTCQDAVELMNKATLKAFNPNKIRRKGGVEGDSSDKTYVASFGHSTINYKVDCNCHDSLQAYASVQYIQTVEDGLATQLGLTPYFIPELVWELTRLSFVVDWWWEVGRWLGTLRFKPYVRILGNTVGLKAVRTIASGNGQMWAAVANARKIAVPSLGLYKLESYQRLTNQHLPLTPQFNLEMLNWIHSVDALSLILQQVLNKIKR